MAQLDIAKVLGASAPLYTRALWWMLPAWLIGRIRPNLTRATDADAIALGNKPERLVRVVLPATVVGVALVPSVMHALTGLPLSSDFVDVLRIRMDDAYTESLVFMAIGIVLGIVSPALGTFLFVVFVPLDLIAAAIQRTELYGLPWSLVGRAISYWLLWLLVVEIPTWGRVIATSEGLGRVGRVRAIIGGTLATGGFVFLWTLLAPTLMRAQFVLANFVAPSIVSILPMQQYGWGLALIAAVVAAAAYTIRHPDDLLGREPAPSGWASSSLWDRREVMIIRRFGPAALLTVAFLGLIKVPTDAFLLFVAFAATRPLASIVLARTGLSRLTGRLPALARLLLAIGAGFGIALLVVPPLYTANDPTFFSVIVGLTAALFVVELILGDPARASDAPTAPNVSPVVVGVLAGLGLLALSVLFPAFAFADNCADPGDCYGLGGAAAAAAGGAGAAFNSRKKDPPRDDPDFIRKKLNYIDKQIKKNPDNQYWKSQKKYWSGDTSAKSDNKKTNAAAFASSGAATKA